VPGAELLSPMLALASPVLAGFLFGLGFWLAQMITRRK
jgi:hypothetical protein